MPLLSYAVCSLIVGFCSSSCSVMVFAIALSKAKSLSDKGLGMSLPLVPASLSIPYSLAMAVPALTAALGWFNRKARS